MLTAAIYRVLAPMVIDPASDLNGDNVIDDFLDRLTSHKWRLAFSLTAGAIVLGYMIGASFKKKSLPWFLAAIPATIATIWAAWGAFNLLFLRGTDDQPLFLIGANLDFYSMFHEPLSWLWIPLVMVFVIVLAYPGKKGFMRLVLALAIVAGLVLVILFSQWGYNWIVCHFDTNGAPAVMRYVAGQTV